ncbi:alpha/beta hydrolase [Chryseolinea sp. T2]|uniref:alpha/beta fold hydrolase n=1 Tax=Chryseolinea sp. T2 TaxID=3129255 RepID=UPI0030776504
MEKVESADGTAIAYTKTGSGPALVVVDGAFCYSSYGPASELAKLLKDRFTVYCYDRRGRGESGNVLPYSIDKEVDDLKALIQITGENPFVLGNSSGGALVIEALAKGVVVNKAAVFEPPYVIRHQSQASFREAHQRLAKLIAMQKRSEALKYFFTEIMEMPGIMVMFLKLFQNKSWKKNEAVAHTLVYDTALMEDQEVLNVINTVSQTPVLVLGGTKSPPRMQSAVRQLADRITHGTLQMLDDQSHNVSMNVLAPQVSSFFLPDRNSD